MSFEKLKEKVCQVNLGLVKAGLVTLTWGNASAALREEGVMGIKPSGVDYDSLTPDDIVIQSIQTGEVIEGSLRPSSDAPTHLLLYRSFKNVAGVVHNHSTFATSWAQACREIPCFGTTHADLFFGSVPITRQLTASEIETAYEENTGKVIAERFIREGLNPLHFPGVLLPYHGPFCWGKDINSALNNAIALEEVAKMALHTQSINPGIMPIPRALLDKHFLRKHGQDAYYGQN